MESRKHEWLYILSISLLAGCSTATSGKSERVPASDSEATVHLIATTDVHGYILAQPSQGSSANPANLMTGGIDVMSGYLNIAKKADPDTLLVDSGDLFQGTIISNTTNGSTVVTWMNYAGYLATAIGNHDFDFGPGDGSNQVTHPGQDPLGVLKAREAQAHFKFLSANICSIDEDPAHCASPTAYPIASFAQPYLIQSVHGVKIGIIGLTTTSTPETTLAANVSSLRFMPFANALERYVPELRAQSVDAIVVLAHEGGFCDKGVCAPTDPIFKAVDQLTPSTRQSIALILAGHTHNFVNTVYNGVRMMINGSYGRSFGYATLTIHNPGQTTASVSVNTQSVDFCAQVYPDTHGCSSGKGTPVAATFLGQPVTADPQALALIASDVARANQQSSQVVGKLITPVTYTGSNPESTLGELMADSLRLCKDAACDSDEDVSFQNNGGIRTKVLEAGSVNYGQVFQTDPFDDYFSELQLKGSQIHDLLVAFYAYNHGSFGQVSGIKITYSKSESVPRKMTNAVGATETLPDPIVRIQMSDGSDLQDQRTYKVAMVDFLATGGSGTAFVLDGVQPPPVVHMDRVLRDLVLDYFKANPQGLDYSKLGGGRIIEQP
jgi:5'-nucleotidase